MKHHLAYVTRIISQFIIFSVCKLFIARGKHAETTPTFHRNKRTLFAANHSNYLDPFAIISSLRYRDYFRLAPFTFMTASLFFKKPGLKPLLWLAGCFPAHPLPNSKQLAGIEASVDFLNNGYTVLIFPEGKRVKGDAVPAKRGITEILQQSPSSRLVLAHIHWAKPTKLGYLRLADLPKHPSDPQEILDKIYKL